MKKKTEREVVAFKGKLPRYCKRIAAMIPDKAKRRAYIDAMIDAETSFQMAKRQKGREKNED